MHLSYGRLPQWVFLAITAFAELLSCDIASACGLTRWAVKTLNDNPPGALWFAPHWASIEYLDSLRPEWKPDFSRINPAESTLWLVRARLVGYRLERDEDYHLILRSARSGLTLIAEIPAPHCAAHEKALFGRARAEVNSIGGRAAERRWRWLNRNSPAPFVIVKGFGFFDYEHGQLGAAPNEFEIHPVIDVRNVKEQ